MIKAFIYKRTVLSLYLRVHKTTERGLIFPEKDNLATTVVQGEVMAFYFTDTTGVQVMKQVEVPEELVTKLENLAKAKKELKNEVGNLEKLLTL